MEAGTAGGRILFEMKARGFTRLSGFDHVPGLIDAACQKDIGRQIKFSVQDAASLNYKNESFDQIIYLQQVICMIEEESARLKAINESYRVLKRGGVALFSFLSYEARICSPLYFFYLVYLRAFRKIRHASLPIQYLPWMKLGGRFNWYCMIDAAPYVYWYRYDEVTQMLQNAGFTISAVGSSAQIERQQALRPVFDPRTQPMSGMLYIVALKPR